MHDVVRLRRIDLQQVIRERFEVAYHERTVGKLLKMLGFPHNGVRPLHPKQDELAIEAFKRLARDLRAHSAHLPRHKPIESWF